MLSGPETVPHPSPGSLLVFAGLDLKILHTPEVDGNQSSRTQADDPFFHLRLAQPRPQYTLLRLVLALGIRGGVWRRYHSDLPQR